MEEDNVKKGERCTVRVSGKLRKRRRMVDGAQTKGGGGVMTLEI